MTEHAEWKATHKKCRIANKYRCAASQKEVNE